MKTPYYCIDITKAQSNFLLLQKSLGIPVYYALKSNSEKKLLLSLFLQGAKFDIASREEFDLALSISNNAQDIICSLPIKSPALIKYLYAHGCRYFVYDSQLELDKLNSFAPKSLKVLRIDVSDLVENNIPFGMPMIDILRIDRETHIDGLTFHIRRNMSIEILLACLDRLQSIIDNLQHKPKLINIGGDYRIPDECGQDFYNQLHKRLYPLCSKYNLECICEPGHGISKSAGSLFTSVIGIKTYNDRKVVYIDSGEPNGLLIQPSSIVITNRLASLADKQYMYDFVGMTCSHEVLFQHKGNFEIKVGDIIKLCNMGSYTISRSSRFHMWKKPQIIFI